ncbi:MAG: chorismate mutase [Dehalococcoidia bacterium]
METALDLSLVRLRLTKMTDRLLMRLHDRAGFPLNRAIYQPGGVPIPGRPGMSLLDFAVEGLETYHASLGRYEFPDQFPLSEASRAAAIAVERPRFPVGGRVEIPLRDDLVGFYVGTVLPRLCEDRDDPNSYGEAAYADADLLELLNERVNVGRDVARSKVEREPDLMSILDDESALRERLRDRAREERVVAEARATAERYALDPDLAASVFEWIIDRTLTLEVQFLRLLPGR